MSALHPCPSCARHVRRDEASCPFCFVAVSLENIPLRPPQTQRLGRAALLFGTALASVTPGCAATHSVDGGADVDYTGCCDASYGAPPDAGTNGSHDADIRGGDVATYGGADSGR